MKKPRLTPAQKEWVCEILYDWPKDDLINELLNSMDAKAIRGWKISYDEYKSMSEK